MPVSFPAIKPTQRRFQPARWPTTSSRSQSGVTSRRLWGDKAGGARLTLEFLCTDEQAYEVLRAHERTKGAITTLVLPDLIWQGVTGSLKTFLEQVAARLDWVFAEGSEPDVEWVSCGRSRVRVELIAELRF